MRVSIPSSAFYTLSTRGWSGVEKESDLVKISLTIEEPVANEMDEKLTEKRTYEL
jgi:hypothetical protein